MSFLQSLDISASALTAQRVRMDVISQNIANIDTTRADGGGPYRRQMTVFAAKQGGSFGDFFESAKRQQAGAGVQVAGIIADPSPFRSEYDPTHPDADAQGYVSYPNVNEVNELVDMMSATRAYEANVTVFNATKNMALKALEIGR